MWDNQKENDIYMSPMTDTLTLHIIYILFSLGKFCCQPTSAGNLSIIIRVEFYTGRHIWQN